VGCIKTSSTSSKKQASEHLLESKQTNNKVAPQSTSAKCSISIQKCEKRIGKSIAKKINTVKWPCGICERECINFLMPFAANRDTWHHFTYLYIDQDDLELQEEEWFCPECKKLDL
jgi:hypothetical protein